MPAMSVCAPPDLDHCLDRAYVVMKREVAVLFFRWGRLVGWHPKTFSLLPLAFTLALTVGVANLHWNNDAEHLFTPVGSQIFQ